MMVKRYSVEEAQGHFATVLEEAEQGTRVEVTRDGRPVALVVSLGGSEQAAAKPADFWSVYEDVRERFEMDRLEIEPEEIFKDVRDPSPGRDFSW